MFRKMDKWLLLISLILFAIGLVMVFSASNIAAFMRYSASPYKFLIKQSLFLFISFALALIVIRINTKMYSFFSWPAIITIIGLLAFVLVYGKTTNHATSWFKIGGLALQPSEFLKIIMIIWMASFYKIKRNNLNSYSTSLFPIFIAIIAFVLILLQPDLGTGIIFALVVMFIFFISPISQDIKIKTTGIALGFLVLGATILISSGKELISSRQLSRFNFFNPCGEEKFYTDGNQICNAYIAVNNGGLLGKGLGNSTQKYLYLPEAHTDFIFAIVLEELGLLSGIGIIILFMLLLSRIIIIGRRAHNNECAIICYGIAFYIFLHIMINLMGIFGMMPMTGVPLPFLSYGGSFTLCLVISLTIVQRVAIENKLFEENKLK